MLLFTNHFLFVTKSWTNKQLNKQSQTKKWTHTKNDKNAPNQAWIQGFLWFWFTKTFLSSLPDFPISLQIFIKVPDIVTFCLVYPFFISTKYLLVTQKFLQIPFAWLSFIKTSSNFLQLSLYSSKPLHILSNCLFTPLFLLPSPSLCLFIHSILCLPL